MSDYTQAYDFTKVDDVDVVTAQDFEDIETEFGSIETAINSKADATGDTVSFVSLTATTSVTFAGATVADLGTVTTAVLNGGTIGGSFTWSAAQNLNSQALTNVNIDSGDISAATVSGSLTWSAAQDLNSQALTNVDINSGSLDGATIGAASPSTAVVTTLQVNTSVAASGAIKDEDDMASDSATALCTQQSVKAYADAAVEWTVVTTAESPVTAAFGKRYYCDLTSGAITITLPSAAAANDGQFIGIKVDHSADTNNLTVNCADADTIADESETALVVDLDYYEAHLVYDDTNTNWGI